MTYQIKNLLITGAAGFIGCNFVRRMLRCYPDIQVVSVDKLTYAGNKENLADIEQCKNHHFVQGDIVDQALIVSLLQHYNIATIVHFAAETHVDNSIINPKLFFETNVIGTLTVLDAARTYWLGEKAWNSSQCRFHHVSTDEVYGSLAADEPPFTEHNLYLPNSPYSASKAGSDHAVRAYHHTYGLPVTSSNCSNNFGPFQHKEKLVPTVIHACLHQQPIPVYGTGSNIRDWLFVDDHCEAIDLILRKGKPGEVYNIGSNNELDNLSLVKKICHFMDDLRPVSRRYDSLIEFVTDRKGHDKRYAIDTGKIHRELGWMPRGQFIEKLISTIQFYIQGQV